MRSYLSLYSQKEDEGTKCGHKTAQLESDHCTSCEQFRLLNAFGSKETLLRPPNAGQRPLAAVRSSQCINFDSFELKIVIT